MKSIAFRNTSTEFTWGLVVGRLILGLHHVSTYNRLALPFLIRAEILLSPLLPLFASYLVSLVGINVASHVLPAYFGS